ncbi:unnamed protein product [Arctia plantaginis]|uniref:Cystatin domain-containing protein n=1 Tax=Arctia plantaginis TaxID=874455 RepID=A0A8S1AFM4_ARCPL|nr:unnamed protein product [Arctia plantaginis]
MAIQRIIFILSACVLLNLAISFALPQPVLRSGGVRNMSVDDPNVKRVAEATLRKLRSQHQGDRALMLVEIEMATYQVVAGAKYHLHLKVGESHCAKNKYTRMCRLDEGRPLLACGSKIWEKRWINFMEINVHCNNYDGSI